MKANGVADRSTARRPAAAAAIAFGLLAWGGAGVAQGPSPGSPAAPEYDPGADHHFLLPSGRVGPRGTGSAGLAAAALPSAGFAYVGGSPLPRASLRFSLLGLGTVMLPFASATLQPLSAGRIQGSVTGLASLPVGDADLDVSALLGSLSFGDDVGRVTVALGSASPSGPGDLRPLFAVGWDYQLDSRDPRVIDVAGTARTVRTRVKLIGELWMLGEDGRDATIGGAGVRMSGERIHLDLVMPFAIWDGSVRFAQMPLINLAFAL